MEVLLLTFVLFKDMEGVETHFGDLHTDQNFGALTGLALLVLHVEKVVEYAFEGLHFVNTFKLTHLIVLLSLLCILSVAVHLFSFSHSD